MTKFKASNETFWVIFKHCAKVEEMLWRLPLQLVSIFITTLDAWIAMITLLGQDLVIQLFKPNGKRLFKIQATLIMESIHLLTVGYRPNSCPECLDNYYLLAILNIMNSWNSVSQVRELFNSADNVIFFKGVQRVVNNKTNKKCHTKAWCLKITEQVSFNIASEATFWVDKSWLKMPKMVRFGEFSKT